MFTWKYLFQDMIHCLSNPCSNGAECNEVGPTFAKPHGSFVCQCKPGFSGDSCQSKFFSTKLVLKPKNIFENTSA